MATIFREKKRFYRSSKYGLLTGVCAGIAQKYNWDLTWVRVAFVGAFLFFSLATVVGYVLLTALTDKESI